MPDVEVTEFEEIDPEELHLVGKGANGFKALLAKSATEEVREVLQTIADDADTEITKADNDRPQCDTCKGAGKIKGGSMVCPKCKGSKLMPKVGETTKELADAAKARAASGVAVPVREDCPTCNGSGTLLAGGECPDCDGSGKDSTQPPSDRLSRVDADGHHIHEGDSKNREKIDKSTADLCDDDECDICKEVFGDEFTVEKAKLKAKTRNALPDSAFALPGRKYPIHDENHARDALARVAQNGTSEEQATVRAAVKRRYPNIDVGGDNATKADGTTFSAPNPQLAAMATKVGDDSSGSSDGDADAPGSAAWEAVDAQTATDAAVALMAASELIRTFAQRESQEVAAGEGNDVFDAYVASDALCGVSHALGIMAQMAFHEGLAAAKSAADPEDIEKAGKRLSRKSISALATARDHITQLLGDDDPANKDKGDGETTKSVEFNMDDLSKEIEDMSIDELTKVLDAREEKLVGIVAEALKGLPAKNNAEAIASAKNANNKAKAKKPKAENTDLENEATQGTNDSASSGATGAAKAEGDPDPDPEDSDGEDAPDEAADEAAKAEDAEVELTPEEIEAKKARKEAKKALRAAEAAEKQATENAAIAKAIEEAVTKATAAVDSLKEQLASAEKATEDRLATVEKMAAPSTAVRTRPADALNKSAERDALELELSKYERLAKSHEDMNYRRECNERAKALRVKIAGISS